MEVKGILLYKGFRFQRPILPTKHPERNKISQSEGLFYLIVPRDV